MIKHYVTDKDNIFAYRIADKSGKFSGNVENHYLYGIRSTRIRGSLEYCIDRNFKFETLILELCPPDRKGRVRELYIHSGTHMGVKPGDLFLVCEEVPVGGVMTRQKVGRLRVNDVGNSDVARCRITKGDDEIAQAFSAGRGLICVSDGKAFGF